MDKRLNQKKNPAPRQPKSKTKKHSEVVLPIFPEYKPKVRNIIDSKTYKLKSKLNKSNKYIFILSFIVGILSILLLFSYQDNNRKDLVIKNLLTKKTTVTKQAKLPDFKRMTYLMTLPNIKKVNLR